MINILKGKKIILFNKFSELIKDKKKILIDMGTGDGRYPYYFALQNPDYISIGIDPVKKLMEKYSFKTTIKKHKGGVTNLFYIISSLNNLPNKLNNLATIITINFPWGSLLESIVKGNIKELKNISKISKNKCLFKTIFTYNTLHEKNEIKKRFLPELSIEYLNSILPNYKKANIKINQVKEFEINELKNLKTLWARKIFITNKRKIYYLSGNIEK